MNTLIESILELPVCDWHKESPWPDLPATPQSPRQNYTFDDAIPEDAREHFRYPGQPNCLPYSMQVGYTRHKTVRKLKSFILENNRLRAEFLPNLGGRLWSLIDKKSGRELLYRNGVIQFAHLAVRNAWISGGIEWNCGFPGHFPYTSTDIFAATLKNDTGQPVLRIYEWERVKHITYQTDFFFLSDDSDALFTATRLVNPNPSDTTAYWWSNCAFPLTPKTRVVVPASQGFVFFDKHVGFVTHTDFHGIDASYPSRVKNAIDFFYSLPSGIRSWETAFDENGEGLLCTSTRLLRGRKLFLWGNGPGSRHWADFLACAENRPYIEIQAGLAPTQLGCRPMPANSEFFWTESYSPFSGAPEILHGDYPQARHYVQDYVNTWLDDDAIDSIAASAHKTAMRPPEKLLHAGSGWGALEAIRRAKCGETRLPVSVVFPEETLGPLQRPWLSLLNGEIPDERPDMPDWQCDDFWKNKLKQAQQQHNTPWLLYHDLVIAMNEYQADVLTQLEALPDALAHSPAFLYLHAIALQRLERKEDALPLWTELLQKCPHDIELFMKAQSPFFDCNRVQDYLAILPSASDDVTGFTMILRIHSLLRLNRLDEAEKLLSEPFEVSMTREGNAALSDLWLELQTRKLAQSSGQTWSDDYHKENMAAFSKDVPYWMDFRMHLEP